MAWSQHSARLILVLGLLAMAARARAFGEPLGLLLEPTYMLPVPVFLQGGESPEGERTALPATFEASIALHVPLTSSLVELDLRDGFAHAFSFVPRVDLRHGLGDSFPIDAPSYYPTVHFQGFHQDHPSPALRRRFVAELLVAHLSNGEDGCLYRDQVRPRGERCQFDDGARHVTAPLNHRTGSFAMNELGLKLGLDYAWAKQRELTFMLGWVIFRPRAGGLDPETQRVYGWGRVEAQLRVARELYAERTARSQLGARVRVEARHGGPHVRNPVSVRIDGFWRFDFLRDWGPFVRLHHGGDYLNVRFDARSTIVGLGMMWEP